MGPNQELIGLLVPDYFEKDTVTQVRLTKMPYAQVSCNGILCQDEIASQLMIDASLDADVVLRDKIAQLPTSSGVRIVFPSRNPNLQANGQIIDTVSGAVVSAFSFGANQTGN